MRRPRAGVNGPARQPPWSARPGRAMLEPMSENFFYMAVAACLATLIVLMIGVLGFGTGKTSPNTSNKLMRLRIVAQFVAIVLIVLTIWAAG